MHAVMKSKPFPQMKIMSGHIYIAKVHTCSGHTYIPRNTHALGEGAAEMNPVLTLESFRQHCASKVTGKVKTLQLAKKIFFTSRKSEIKNSG